MQSLPPLKEMATDSGPRSSRPDTMQSSADAMRLDKGSVGYKVM